MLNIKEKAKNVLVTILVLTFVASTISVAVDVNNKMTETENTITVSGTGFVYVQPELAMVNLSVISEAETIEEAMQDNSEKMNAIISFMKDQGIEDRDLKTIGFNIYPRYEWQENTLLSQRVLVGYEIRQSLEVKIRDIEKVGKIIEGGTAAGANQASDLYFTIDEDTQERLEKEARGKAIEQAKSNAEELSRQLGVKLVRIRRFNENSSVVAFPSPVKNEAMGMGEVDSAAPKIQTGEDKIEINVSITYDIN